MKTKPIKFRRGVEFGLVGAGKSGEIISKLDKMRMAKHQRRLWRKIQKEYYE